MDQDRKHWPKVGPTGDREEDKRRERAVLNRLKRIIKEYKLGQIDLFSGLGGAIKPTNERKLADERRTVMIAYAFGLDDDIPLTLAKKVGLEPGPNPPVPQSDPNEISF